MAEQKIPMSPDDIAALVSKGVSEALSKLQLPQQQQAPTDPQDSFTANMKLRERARGDVWPFQYRAFRSPTGGIGVAYICSSTTFPAGRILKFETYESPPGEQLEGVSDIPPDLLADPIKHRERIDAWKDSIKLEVYKLYYCADLNSYTNGKDAAILPNAQPPRATLGESLADMDRLRVQRDADWADRQARQRRAELNPKEATHLPLPPTVPATV